MTSRMKYTVFVALAINCEWMALSRPFLHLILILISSGWLAFAGIVPGIGIFIARCAKLRTSHILGGKTRRDCILSGDEGISASES